MGHLQGGGSLSKKIRAGGGALAAPLPADPSLRHPLLRKVAAWTVAGLLGGLVGLSLFVTFFTNHVYVTTPSMYPTIPPGSLVFIQKKPRYDVGDVIEFRGNGLDFLHRIVRMSPSGVITTKGDNPENAPDAFFPPTTTADVVGKAILAPRWVGFPEMIAHQPGLGLSWLRAELGLSGRLIIVAVTGLVAFGAAWGPGARDRRPEPG